MQQEAQNSVQAGSRPDLKAQNSAGARFDGTPSFRSATMGETNYNLKDWQEVVTDKEQDRSSHNDAASMTSTQRNIPLSGMMGTGAADFFSPEIFQIVLHNPTTSHQLLQYSQSRFCGENMEFLERVDRYNTLLDELTKVMSEIYRNYTSVEAPRALNISQGLIKQINMDIKTTTLNTLPAMELIFSDSQVCVENILATDIYPRFVKHQMTVSAEKALSAGRQKYAGLGDCFCLTSPAKADNPIVFASDGFIKVTGYSRQDIIPRNCRFLQGKYTDQGASRRLREAIDANQESVELLLNYRKTGEPFWNLLYVAPLFNAEGKVVFYLGGQINCSTTIHSRSDILRVLSMSDKAEEDNVTVEQSMPTAASSSGRKGGFFRSFKMGRNTRQTPTIPEDREAGMENQLINKIQKLNFKNQMKMFYTAYSKYLVLSYERLAVEFFSTGVVDMLLVDPKSDTGFLGNDIFKVLAQYSPMLSKEFKNRIKTQLRQGRAISADINLATRRAIVTHGSERFATHWTPLKNEHAVVRYVVVTFAPYQQD
ncbi:hypothetical protein MMC26_001493 [Xylographa opegraphella]|nr:hypothetical protein [Xylographa opegraphella]